MARLLALIALVSSVLACTDNTSNGRNDCIFARTHCNVEEYYDFMTLNCPVTCGRCPIPDAVCIDEINNKTMRSDCPNAKAWCNVPDYREFMTQVPQDVWPLRHQLDPYHPVYYGWSLG